MLYTFLNLEYFSISSMLNANVKLTWETVLIAPGGHSMNYTFTLLYAEHKGHFDVVIVGHLCFDVCRTLNLYARCITAVSNCKCNLALYRKYYTWCVVTRIANIWIYQIFDSLVTTVDLYVEGVDFRFRLCVDDCRPSRKVCFVRSDLKKY